MLLFDSRYLAKKSHPNGLVRKVLLSGLVGKYVVFYDLTTYLKWKKDKYVK